MASTLPIELQLYIFEMSVKQSRNMGPTIIRLSSYVYKIILPIFYEILVVSVSRGPRKEALQKYGHHIRHIFLDGGDQDDSDIDTELLHTYFRSCTNITNLAFGTNLPIEQEMLSLIKKLPLVRLSIYPYDLGIIDWDPSVERREAIQNLFASFTQLTHLQFSASFNPYFFPSLASLPKLTYLSIYYVPWMSWQILDLRRDCPNLKVIVVPREDVELEGYKEGDKDLLELAQDPRAISCVVLDLFVDRERGARGEPDSYEFALRRLNDRIASRRLDGLE